MTSKSARFHRLIAAEAILVQPGVYDGFSARLVQQMAFKSAAIFGAGLREANLGWADVGLMGYEEGDRAAGAGSVLPQISRFNGIHHDQRHGAAISDTVPARAKYGTAR
jgi:hypothetical protein